MKFYLLSILGRRELNVKALVGTFNQEKALVGAFSVIVKTGGPLDPGPAQMSSVSLSLLISVISADL